VSSEVLPRRAALARAGDAPRPHLAGELVVVALLLFAYDRVRRHAAPRREQALADGQAVLGAERRLHLDWEHTANVWLAHHLTLRDIASWWYQLAHLTLAMSVLAWCWFAAPAVYRVARNTLVLTNVAGLIVFAVCPVAPPRLLPGAGFSDSIAVALGTGQAAHPPPDEYAAMPSLHLAWATWVVFTVWAITAHTGRLHSLRAPAVLHPVLTGTAVVATANHYVLDVVAGVALALLARGLAGVITTRSDDASAQQEREHTARGHQRQPHRDQPVGDHRTDRGGTVHADRDQRSGEQHVEGAQPTGRGNQRGHG
jgi:membrane-associated phospholipid phosphatase